MQLLARYPPEPSPNGFAFLTGDDSKGLSGFVRPKNSFFSHGPSTGPNVGFPGRAGGQNQNGLGRIRLFPFSISGLS